LLVLPLLWPLARAPTPRTRPPWLVTLLRCYYCRESPPRPTPRPAPWHACLPPWGCCPWSATRASHNRHGLRSFTGDACWW
jgi:hypothetical protein